jgi:hypothetical protein
MNRCRLPERKRIFVFDEKVAGKAAAEKIPALDKPGGQFAVQPCA